jgi:hypothetical protein
MGEPVSGGGISLISREKTGNFADPAGLAGSLSKKSRGTTGLFGGNSLINGTGN